MSYCGILSTLARVGDLTVRRNGRGFFVCTIEESATVDAGGDIGPDGRLHWPSEERAWLAAAERAREAFFGGDNAAEMVEGKTRHG